MLDNDISELNESFSKQSVGEYDIVISGNSQEVEEGTQAEIGESISENEQLTHKQKESRRRNKRRRERQARISVK